MLMSGHAGFYHTYTAFWQEQVLDRSYLYGEVGVGVIRG